MKMNLFCFISLCLISIMPVAAAAKTDAGVMLDKGLACYRRYDLAAAAKEFSDGLDAARHAKDYRYEESFAAGLGLTYRAKGDYRKAVYYTGEALAASERLKDRRRVAVNLVNLGIITALMDNQNKALSYYDDALRILHERRDNVETGITQLHAAAACTKLGLRQKAMARLKDALRIFVSLGKRNEIGNTLFALGDLYREYGDIAHAVAYYESALKTGREIRDDSLSARSLASLGLAEYEQGDCDRSVSCLKEGFALSRSMSDPKAMVDNLNRLGMTYLKLKDQGHAQFSCMQALEIARTTGSNILIADSLENLGRIAQSAGSYTDALTYLTQALALKTEVGLPGDDTRTAIADCFLETGELEKAEDIFLKIGDAVRLGRLQLAHKNYKRAIQYFCTTFEEKPGSRDPGALFASYAGIGRAFALLGDHQSAVENYAKAIDLFEDQENYLGINGPFRLSDTEVHGFRPSAPYEGIVKSLCALDRPEEAFQYSESLKLENYTRSVLASPLPKAGRGISLAMAQEEDDNLVKIHALTRESLALLREGDAGDRAETEQRLAAAREKHRKFIERLRAFYPAYAALRYPSPHAGRELQLEKNELLLEFEVTGDATCLFLVSGGNRRVKAHTIGMSRRDLEARVREYLASIASTPAHTAAAPGPSPLARRLFVDLFGKALDDISDGRTLTIVPDECLGMLPFESLVTDENESGPLFMGDRWHVRYAQSATWMDITNGRMRYNDAGDAALVICPPAVPATDASAGGNPEIIDAIGAWETGGERPDGGSAIGKRTQEGYAVDQFSLLCGTGAVTLSSLPAGVESVAAVPFEGYKYILFGLDCILSETSPYMQQPFFVLPDALKSSKQGRILSMNRFAGVYMPADAVAIPYSEIGPVTTAGGRGPLAMARTLQAAGSGAVLLSLWHTSDEAAATVCRVFFASLVQGRTPQEALEHAKKQVRQNGFTHPYYWAGFILSGE